MKTFNQYLETTSPQDLEQAYIAVDNSLKDFVKLLNNDPILSKFGSVTQRMQSQLPLPQEERLVAPF